MTDQAAGEGRGACGRTDAPTRGVIEGGISYAASGSSSLNIPALGDMAIAEALRASEARAE